MKPSEWNGISSCQRNMITPVLISTTTTVSGTVCALYDYSTIHLQFPTGFSMRKRKANSSMNMSSVDLHTVYLHASVPHHSEPTNSVMSMTARLRFDNPMSSAPAMPAQPVSSGFSTASSS